MILYRWQGAARNFGDELNTVLWPALLPGFFDDDPAERFIGIGSVLDRRHDNSCRKLVAGAGYGGYQCPPALNDGWDIRFVDQVPYFIPPPWVDPARTPHRGGRVLFPAAA